MWEVIRSFAQLCRKKYEYACADTKVRLCVTLMGKNILRFCSTWYYRKINFRYECNTLHK